VSVRNKPRPGHVSGAIVVSIVAVLGLSPSTVAAAEPSPVPTWPAPLVENFDAFDTGRWYPYQPPDDEANNPRRTPDLVSVGDGHLQLTGSVTAAGLEIGAAVGDNHEQKYGRWEVRFRADPGRGYGAAVLLWPAGGGRWPDDGEIDLIEVPSPQRDLAINSLHNGHNGHDDNKDAQAVRADFTTWHTVAVDWLPHSVTYYLDGVETWRSPRTSLVPTTTPMRLALQLDECADRVYHGFIPCRDASSPERVVMEVDWVKVFSTTPAILDANAAGTFPPPPSTTTSTSAPPQAAGAAPRSTAAPAADETSPVAVRAVPRFTG
jgi:hypothetical protein